jgi:hypothetical protein
MYESGLDPDSMGSADPDTDWAFASGSRQAKLFPKKERKKSFIFEELSAGLEVSPGAQISFLKV